MTITFDATSKSDLLIRELSPERNLPVKNVEDLLKRWIPYQNSLQQQYQESQTVPDYVCVPGSTFNHNKDNEDGTVTTLPTYSGLIGTILTAYNLIRILN